MVFYLDLDWLENGEARPHLSMYIIEQNKFKLISVLASILRLPFNWTAGGRLCSAKLKCGPQPDQKAITFRLVRL